MIHVTLGGKYSSFSEQYLSVENIWNFEQGIFALQNSKACA